MPKRSHKVYPLNEKKKVPELTRKENSGMLRCQDPREEQICKTVKKEKEVSANCVVSPLATRLITARGFGHLLDILERVPCR